MSKAAKNKKKRNVVREHPHRKYGSKRPVTLSRKQTNLAPAQVIHRVSKGLPFSELEHLSGAVPLDYASTEVGAREIENLLGRIEYSVYS